MSSQPSTPYFDRSIGAAVPLSLYEAAISAATRQGLTLADYVRQGISRQLAADGVPHPTLPPLRRLTFQHRSFR